MGISFASKSKPIKLWIVILSALMCATVAQIVVAPRPTFQIIPVPITPTRPQPTSFPTPERFVTETKNPTPFPTRKQTQPTGFPTPEKVVAETEKPTPFPTRKQTQPTGFPTPEIIVDETKEPTPFPTRQQARPTGFPTPEIVVDETKEPTPFPTRQQIRPTRFPTPENIVEETKEPTPFPTRQETRPTESPTPENPVETPRPTRFPTPQRETQAPTNFPTVDRVTSNPTTSNPTTSSPTTSSPTTSSPTTSSPTTSSPTTSNPTTSNPTTSNPTTSNPTTSNPTTSNPTTSNPTTSSPTTSNPTTSSPTTSSPTTSSPTTSSPTTSSPTTSNPTTSSPTTSNPTTSSPTTSNTATSNPTTSNPTTSQSTTSRPTTSDLIFPQATASPTLFQCNCTSGMQCEEYSTDCGVYLFGQFIREYETSLCLSNNDLTGTLPSEIGILTNLQRIQLDRNQLYGSIPSEIGHLSRLTHLNISYNMLSGYIPREIQFVDEREDESLDFLLETAYECVEQILGTSNFGERQNDLASIFDKIGFDVENNMLSGSVPKELGGIHGGLWLRNNSFEPILPEEVANHLNDVFVDEYVCALEENINNISICTFSLDSVDDDSVVAGTTAINIVMSTFIALYVLGSLATAQFGSTISGISQSELTSDVFEMVSFGQYIATGALLNLPSAPFEYTQFASDLSWLLFLINPFNSGEAEENSALSTSLGSSRRLEVERSTFEYYSEIINVQVEYFFVTFAVVFTLVYLTLIAITAVKVLILKRKQSKSSNTKNTCRPALVPPLPFCVRAKATFINLLYSVTLPLVIVLCNQLALLALNPEGYNNEAILAFGVLAILTLLMLLYLLSLAVKSTFKFPQLNGNHPVVYLATDDNKIKDEKRRRKKLISEMRHSDRIFMSLVKEWTHRNRLFWIIRIFVSAVRGILVVFVQNPTPIQGSVFLAVAVLYFALVLKTNPYHISMQNKIAIFAAFLYIPNTVLLVIWGLSSLNLSETTSKMLGRLQILLNVLSILLIALLSVSKYIVRTKWFRQKCDFLNFTESSPTCDDNLNPAKNQVDTSSDSSKAEILSSCSHQQSSFIVNVDDQNDKCGVIVDKKLHEFSDDEVNSIFKECLDLKSEIAGLRKKCKQLETQSSTENSNQQHSVGETPNTCPVFISVSADKINDNSADTINLMIMELLELKAEVVELRQKHKALEAENQNQNYDGDQNLQRLDGSVNSNNNFQLETT